MSQYPLVITGYNTDIKHSDRVYHVQTEDKGLGNPTIESLIYMGGKILTSRQYSYAWMLRQGYDENALQEFVDAQHRKMIRDIRGGKFDPEGPPPFGAGIITERGFDEVVLEFLGGEAAAERLELVVQGKPSPRAGDLLVLELVVRGEATSRPLAGAALSVRATAAGGRSVSLFEGQTDAAGRARAGIDIPRELGGGTLEIEATSPRGSDGTRLQICEP